MKNAIVIDANEIKAMLAEKFNVPEANVVKSQYSYTVILDGDEKQHNFPVIRKEVPEERWHETSPELFKNEA